MCCLVRAIDEYGAFCSHSFCSPPCDTRPCTKITWRAELIILYTVKFLINYSLFVVCILTSTCFLNVCYLHTFTRIQNISCVTPYRKNNKILNTYDLCRTMHRNIFV